MAQPTLSDPDVLASASASAPASASTSASSAAASPLPHLPPVDPTPDADGASQPQRTAAEKWHNPLGPPVGSNFGARLLQEQDDVWNHNAWDHVELPSDFHEKAEEQLAVQLAAPVREELRESYNAKPAMFWDKFYSRNKDAFFKDRAWLRLEFPELIECTEAHAGPKTILEVGCGAGNTVFPLLNHNENPDLTLWATDYSAQAVEVVKSNPMYPRAPHGKGVLHAAVWDISAGASSLPTLSDSTAAPASTAAVLPPGVAPGSIDILTAIFVLSALHPLEWRQAMINLHAALKPGGLLLIRDYGRHDLAQLRMKRERALDPSWPNLYIRGDGTRVFFFTKADLEGLMLLEADPNPPTRGFEVEQLGEDRRLLVNRKERKQMYRIWMQVKARRI